MILPIICAGLPMAAYIARLTRAGMLEVIRSDFVRTARAKGLSERRVIWKHALRGGLLPVVSFLGPGFSGLLVGSLVVEKIFNIPGMGRYLVEAAQNREYNLLVGVTLVYAFILLIANTVVDIAYAFLDPGWSSADGHLDARAPHQYRDAGEGLQPRPGRPPPPRQEPRRRRRRGGAGRADHRLHPRAFASRWRYDQADLVTGPAAPSWEHWMGTDYFGRDLLARVFFGGRISFAVGLFATLVSFFIGVTWGGIAGYFGGKVDAILMRIVDVLYAIPFFIVVILLMVFFAGQEGPLFKAFRSVLRFFVAHPEDPSYFPIFQILIVFAALGGISWLTMARIVRGQVIALRGQPFVEAARSIGAGHAALIFRHLLPNALGPIIIYTTLTIPEIMMTEAFLSFLGLGTQEPLSSWGLLAANGADSMDLYPGP